MVKQPLKFSMNDLMRYRAVSTFNFMECSGNTLTDWQNAKATTVQQSHGLRVLRPMDRHTGLRVA